ncbi:MAG: hypothetical protein WCY22_04790 [Acholeplasmataceae bacterium]
MLVITGKNNIAVNALRYAAENCQLDVAVICNKNGMRAHGRKMSLRKVAQELGIKEVTKQEAYVVASIIICLKFDKIVKVEKF